MPPQQFGLSRIQNWMQTVIAHPGGVRDGVNSEEAARHITVDCDTVERVVTRSRRLTALDRLAVYGAAYYGRLLDCMREEFPVLKHALGEELFDAFAVDYLGRYPSRTYTLFRLASDFPRFLSESRPDRDEGGGAPTNWPDFLIDLATLELTFNEVFDGPGIERQRWLEADDLQAIAPEKMIEARLAPAPCLRLLAFHYPVHEYLAAVRRHEDPDLPGPADTWLAVSRRRHVVRHYELSRPAYHLLHSLLAGQTLGEAIASATDVADPEVDYLENDLWMWFHDWAAEGFFSAVRIAN